jgi:cytochrome c oxidase subunit IV
VRDIMHEAVAAPLAAWESFYVIVGSSSAALIGLQFVVIALLAETKMRRSWQEIDAFATPTILHFGAALLVSAILSAPWPTLWSVALALGMCGSVGTAYVGVVISRARRQTHYKMVLEDWTWHIVLPVLAYMALLAGALALERNVLVALFVVAAAALLLLFIGIHNAWDTVTYITLSNVPAPDESAERK